MMHYSNGFFGHMGSWWLFQILILVLFFLIIWWLIKNSSIFGLKCSDNDSADEILKKRLAKGEISIKEYQQLKKSL